MIPVEIDVRQILADLNACGWRDYKIEIACGFSEGYVAQLRCVNVRSMSYQRAARLYNFWESEVPHGTLPIRADEATT